MQKVIKHSCKSHALSGASSWFSRLSKTDVEAKIRTYRILSVLILVAFWLLLLPGFGGSFFVPIAFPFLILLAFLLFYGNKTVKKRQSLAEVQALVFEAMPHTKNI